MFEREFPQNAGFEYSKEHAKPATLNEIDSDGHGAEPHRRVESPRPNVALAQTTNGDATHLNAPHGDAMRVDFVVEAVATSEIALGVVLNGVVYFAEEDNSIAQNEEANAPLANAPEEELREDASEVAPEVTLGDTSNVASDVSSEVEFDAAADDVSGVATEDGAEAEATVAPPVERAHEKVPVEDRIESDDDGPTHHVEADARRERHFESTTGGSLRHAEFDRMFREWRQSGDAGLRDRMILMNRGLVAYLARRFSDRGEMSEDLMQQGLIGLINALDSFDPDRGARFVTFATPTILGEMRRYVRDRSWGVRVPRRLHEIHKVINHRIETLTQQFDRSPTYSEIALSLNLQVEEVIEALELTNAADPVSFDEVDGSSDGEGKLPISERLGALDSDLESLNDHAILRAALDKLEPRERQVLEAVYFQGHSQLVVAQQMKVSQMNVSRLQRRALAHLRELMNSGDL